MADSSNRVSSVAFQIEVQRALVRSSIGEREGIVSIRGGLRLDHGNIQNTHITAPVAVQNWNTWKSSVPKVFVDATWIRKHVDWHCFNDGSLCVIYKQEWLDINKQRVKLHGEVSTAVWAAGWLIYASASLAYRHYLAHLTGVTAWPNSWDAFPHDDKAARLKYYGRKQRSAYV